MALTIQQLYDKYTGREADPAGLKFWTEGFLGNGDTVIDANEEASFARAVAAARAQGTEPAAVKPVATTTTTTTAPAATTTTTAPATTTATTSAPINLNNGTFLTAAGKIVDASGNVLADTGYAATATLTQQILGQNLTDKWQGQGWGTAQANASDMARMMATAGITDIKQFGVIPDLEPVVPIDTLYNGKRVRTQIDEDGKTSSYIYEPTGKMVTGSSWDGGDYEYPEMRVVEVPKDAKLETVYGVARDGGEYGSSYVPVDQSKIKTVDGKLVGDAGKTTFGNKLTGQAIANNYETGSNAFGGTTAGKGNTGYRVQFAPDGTPLFYTSGASSSDIGQLMPLIQIGLAASGAGGLLGNAILGTGAGQVASSALGNAILGGATSGLAGGNVLQGALLGGAGGALSGYLQGAPSALDAGMGVYPSTGNIGLPTIAGTAASVLGDGFTPAGPPSGTGTFLGEGALSGIAASDAALANATVGATGLTMAQLAQLDLALGGAGGTLGAETLAAALTTGATVPTLTNLTGGSGLLTGAAGGITADSVANALAGGGVASTLGGAGGVTAGGVTAGGITSGLNTSLINAGIGSVVNSILGGGGSNLISGGLGTAGNLLQMQQSREAAQKAQAMIDAETAAAKQAAAFRPVGMTTRFGTSQFQVDPVTGRLTSAGYTLSPEAKAQQDRLMALSNQGLTQAEQAQGQFAPLQTGAQRLFGLGNQYLAQSPEAVAQNYLNQQMALLQPGRELELATLQNRLQQQGRGGLSVAQGGTLGATTPELQALYNARATQEAQLAAQAQQAGQQQVAFGAGLLNQGAGAMGQYYSGQQAAYAPYTTAMGQVQGLEALGQQPLTMGAQLGQTSSTAGARVGQLGLEGARLSANLATSADATRNLGAQSLIAAGNPNSQFGSAIGGLLGGGLQSMISGTGLGSSGFGTGLAYGNQDLGLFL